MSAFFLRTPHARPPAGERVFADDSARLWSASPVLSNAEWAILFVCVTDARTAPRAIHVDDVERLNGCPERLLRDWLARAPRMGALS